MSKLEIEFEQQLHLAGAPPWKREYRFCPSRQWRFDFAWPGELVAVEIEGIVWGKSKGRHQTGVGFSEDAVKYNVATLAGWMLVRITGHHIMSGLGLSWLEFALARRGMREPLRGGHETCAATVIGKDASVLAEMAAGLSAGVSRYARKPNARRR